MPRTPYLPAGHQWGWDRDAEDWKWIKSTEGSAEPVMAFAGEYLEQRFDPRPIINNQSQRSWPSCRGHSGASGIEWLYWLARGQTREFSRMFCWVESQRLTWRRASKSRGATMSSGWKLMETKGISLEEHYQYPYPRYDNDTPQAAWTSAANFKTKNRIRIQSYEEARAFLGSGQGFIEAGIRWDSNMRRAGARVENYSGRGGGGHALLFPCLGFKSDRDGNPDIELTNSHGRRWGNQGTASISMRAFQKICDHSYTTMAGISDLTTPEIRYGGWGVLL